MDKKLKDRQALMKYLITSPFEICYEVCKDLIKEKRYDKALFFLLFIERGLKTNELIYRSHIHSLIAELLSKKYPFLHFYQRTSEFYNKYNSIESRSYIGYEESKVDFKSEILDSFIEQKEWRYYNLFKEYLNDYSRFRMACNSLMIDDGYSHEFLELIRCSPLNEILKKKLRLYFWETFVNFGIHSGSSIKEIFDLEPKIIFEYLINLQHFTLPTNIFLSYDLLIAAGSANQYWNLFEKNLMKSLLWSEQMQIISLIKDLKREHSKRHKDENSIYLWNGDDEESHIMRGLMNGNGDQFGF